jgi:ABC-type branched-subunit amino acid transport system ATPase component
MTGAYRRDAGVIEYNQKNVAFQNPTQAQAAGIVAVYQEIQLVDLRTVAENIFLGREPHRFGMINRQVMMKSKKPDLGWSACGSLGLGNRCDRRHCHRRHISRRRSGRRVPNANRCTFTRNDVQPCES